MQATRLYLIRHGQVAGFQEQRYNGHTDVALTELGRRQSRAISARLADASLGAVISSDLKRSVYAAGLIAAAHALEARVHRELRELDIGDWEGMTWSEIQTRYPEAWQARLADLANYRAPGGESLRDAAERVRPVLNRYLEQFRGGSIALVGHGGTNRVILLDALDAPLDKAFAIEQDYGCLNIIDYFADGNRVIRLLNGPNPEQDPCDR